MNRRQDRQGRLLQKGLAQQGLLQQGMGLFALVGVSCLPTDNLSEYSKGGLLTGPDESLLNGGTSEETPVGDAPVDGVAEGASGDGVGADGVLAEAPPLSVGGVDDSSLEGTSAPCTGDCTPPTLALDLDAGPAPAESSGDAGTPAPADAGPGSSCVQGASLGLDQRCFALIATPSTWQDARTACQAKGTGWDLTTIHSAARNRFLATFLGTVTDAWVGASDTQTEGVWRWLGDSGAFWNGTATGSPVGNAFVSWAGGTNPEPNGGEASDCLRLRAGGVWADLQCTTPFAAICEGPTL